jgi:hypothetical protein
MDFVIALVVMSIVMAVSSYAAIKNSRRARQAQRDLIK